MKTLAALFIWPLFAAADTQAAGQVWAPVAAALGSGFPGAVAVAEAPSGDVIRYVGQAAAGRRQNALPAPVFAVELAEFPSRVPGAVSPAAEQPIPVGAQWPDARDRIEIASTGRRDTLANAAIRNPWEVRARIKVPGEETVFTCGGVIMGGGGDSVALLNGHVLRRGETIGGFSVARILANEVVLERNGSYVVLPRGRHVTVATAGR